MNRNLLNLYEDTCRKAAEWLNEPMSRADFEPILKLVSPGSEKVRFSMKLLKAVVSGRTAPMASYVRGHLGVTMMEVGSAALRGTAILLEVVAREKVRWLTARYSGAARAGNQRKLARFTRVFETACWVAAVGTMGYCSFVYTTSTVHHAQQDDLFNSKKIQPDPAGTLFNSPDGKLLGFLDIPRIGVSSIVEEGSGPNILSRSVGHVPGTALPGERGSVGLAGHLDTYRQELSKLRIGDVLTFRSPTRIFAYSVVSTAVVGTTDTRISPPSNQSMLTLINYLPISDRTKTAKQLVIVARENLPIEPYLIR